MWPSRECQEGREEKDGEPKKDEDKDEEEEAANVPVPASLLFLSR